MTLLVLAIVNTETVESMQLQFKDLEQLCEAYHAAIESARGEWKRCQTIPALDKPDREAGNGLVSDLLNQQLGEVE